MKRTDPFDIVRAIGKTLPDAEESPYWGAPALKIHGRPFACMASHSSAEPDTLVVWTDPDQREYLIAEEPAIYYLKEHYESWPLVLVRLRRIDREALRDLLIGARQIVAAKGPARKRVARKPATKSRRTIQRKAR